MADETSLAQLVAELRRVDQLIRGRAEQRMQQQGHQSMDGLWGLYISEEEAAEVLRADLLEGARFENAMVGLGATAPEPGAPTDSGNKPKSRPRRPAKQSPSRVDRLTSLYGLDDFERLVLLVCLLPEVSLEYERLFGYLQNDVTKRRPTVDLLLSLFCSSLTDALAHRRYFSTHAPLIRERLVSLESPEGSAPSFIARYVKLDEGALSYLLGQDDFGRRLAPFVELVRPEFGLNDLILSSSLRRELELLVYAAKNGSTFPICYLHGPEGIGRRSIAQAVCREAGIPLLMVDVDQLLENAAQLPAETAIQLVLREAKLRDSATCWLHTDLLLSSSAPQGLARRLLTQAAAYGGPTFFCGEEPWEPSAVHGRFLSLKIAMPDTRQRQELWQAYLNGSSPSLPEGTVGALAESFRLTAGQIRDAVATARRLSAQSQEGHLQPSPDDLYEAARLRSRHRLSNLARQVELRFSWDDIILPRDQTDRLSEICMYVRYRSQVIDCWGFARILPTNKGLSILFAGPSGTGKTMAASIIARELGLDMFKIDLSTVVSKYIGETEKNLERIFEDGENSNAILFFDEADALFGKRSEVSDSHDRYANIEIAYLLQRMEDYGGIVILATNLRRNLDEAFTRRLDFAVDFPLPEEADRLRIWRKVLPSEAPLAANVDLPFLASQFKLSGGSIRNAAIAAAFLAAAEGKEIGMRHFLRAIRREHQKMGKLMADADFGPYRELVRAE